MRLVHTLLTATNEQPYGFLRVRGADLIREVKLMADAGLVQASRGEDGDGPVAVINRVTDEGEAFLRAFRNHVPATNEAETFASAQ